MTRTLSEIRIYPVKSTGGILLTRTELQKRGLALDRRMMLTDPSGQFLTARKEPRLIKIQSTLTDEGVQLNAPGMETLFVPYNLDPIAYQDVSIWKDRILAYPAPDTFNSWFSEYLGRPVRLVLMGPESKRSIDGDEQPEEITFVDKYPLLLISEASLEDLNTKLERSVDMTHFRPNLVVKGCEPYEEDQWRSIRINGIRFRSGGLCARCSLVNVQPSSGIPNPDHEPLKTLSSYRNVDGKVMFGLNLIPETAGTLEIGMSVEVD